MKKSISPEVQEFLKKIPKLAADLQLQNFEENTETITEKDEARIKAMLNNSTDPQAQADRKALMQYILNFRPENDIKINDADRNAMAAYLHRYAPEFYKLIQKL